MVLWKNRKPIGILDMVEVELRTLALYTIYLNGYMDFGIHGKIFTLTLKVYADATL